MEDSRIRYSEDDVPLDGLEQTAAEVVETYGGRITSSDRGRMAFNLPRRRGAESAGFVSCVLEWPDAGDRGVVQLTADREIDASRPQRIALLIAGTIGALLFTVWPFFPEVMGNVAGVGLVVAVAVYLLTLRQTPHSLVSDLLQQIVRAQDDGTEAEPEAES